jgi:WD40 repeat protein
VDQPDRSILVQHLETGERKMLPKASDDYGYLRFSPSGRKLAVASRSPPAVQIWDLATQAVTNLPHAAMIMNVAWWADEKLLAAASTDRHIYVWEVEAARVRSVLKGHEATADHLSLHPDQRLLVSWGWDGTSRLWDTWMGEEVLTLAGYKQMGFSADGRFLALGAGRQLSVWEVATGSESRVLRGEKLNSLDDFRVVVFDPEGRFLAASTPSEVHLWRLPELDKAATIPAKEEVSLAFHPTKPSLLTVTPDGLQRWPLPVDATSSTARIPGPPETLAQPGAGRPRLLRLSADGRLAHIEDHSPRRGLVFDLETRQTIARLDHSGFNGAALSADGRWAAAGNRGLSGVRVWDARTGIVQRDLPVVGSALAHFSPDNRWLVVGSTEEYQFWEVGSWTKAHRIPRGASLNAPGLAAFTADGKVMASAHSVSLIKLVETDSGRELAALDPPKFEHVADLAISADGSWLAVSSNARGVRVWDLRRIRQQLAAMNLDWD